MMAALHIAATLLSALALATPAGASIPLPTTEKLPVIEGTPETRSIPFLAWHEDLSRHGYVEEEYLLSGLANVYDLIDPDGISSEVEIVVPDIDYVTRILVRRPADGERFDGTVVLEILNATAKYDDAPMWDFTHRTLINHHAAWVGVTYDDASADFMRDTWGTPEFPAPADAAKRNNDRYATLNIDQWGLAWDLLMQTAALLKSADPRNPFATQRVARIIPGGYSQSGPLVVTLANSFHSMATRNEVALFDGYYVGAGGRQGRALRTNGTAPSTLPVGDLRNFINPGVPVIRLQTEYEVNGTSWEVRSNMEDHPLVRFYEMAGGSHVDEELYLNGSKLEAVNFATERGSIDCGLPLNPMRVSYVAGALFVALDEWIRAGIPPPGNRFIKLDADNNIIRDADGNSRGGLRPATLRVPLGAYAGNNVYPEGLDPRDMSTWGDWVPTFCALYGSFAAFDKQELDRRYPGRRDYIAAVEQAVSRTIADGFLLEEDGEQIVTAAKTAGVGEQRASSGSSSATSPLLLCVLLAWGWLCAGRRH
jgi:hypothetical protein